MRLKKHKQKQRPTYVQSREGEEEQKLSTFIDLKGSPSSLRLGSVSSRGCLDAPAVLPTRDAGGEYLLIKKKRKVSRITAFKTSLFKSTEISRKRKRSNLPKALLE